MTAPLAIAPGATLADLAGLETRSGPLALSPAQAGVLAEQLGGGAAWRLMEGERLIGAGGVYPLGDHLVAWMIAGRRLGACALPALRRMRTFLAEHAAFVGRAIRCEVLRTNSEGRRLARLLGFRPVSLSATGIVTLEWRPR